MIDYRKHDEVFSGINIVPFTDVILVLLVIFMIAAPGIVNSGLDISLPGSDTASSELPARLSVSLDREGRVFLDGRQVSGDGLRLQIKNLVERRKDLTIVLNADQSAQHGRVIEVLDTLRNSGARNIYVGAVRR